MRLPEHEREAHRQAFRAMSLPQKLEYVFAYYKLPLVLVFIAAVALGSVLNYQLTHKEPVLYVAYCNVGLPEEQDQELFDGFLASMGANPKTQESYRYYNLYLSEAEESVDHQYSYASRLKTLAAVDAEELDVVFMNQGAYDLLSASGFLVDLQKTCVGDLALPAGAGKRIETNTVVLSDNSVEVELGEADQYVADTVEAANALSLDDLPLMAGYPEDEEFYLGIIANTPRLETSVAYLAYVLGE